VARRYGDVWYLTGGTDKEDRAALVGAARGYSLCLAYLNRSGAGLAGVDTRIYRPNGRLVFHVVSDGPLLLVRLQPGRYRIVASSDGDAVVMPLTVRSRGQVAMKLRWLGAARLRV